MNHGSINTPGTDHPLLRRSRPRSRPRHGLLLPLVLATMLIVLTISATLVQASWRSSRGAQLQWQAQRGLYAADAAVVRRISAWAPDTVAATPIGTALVHGQQLADGWRLQTSIVRTGPLRAVVLGVARRGRPVVAGAGDPVQMKRVVTRTVQLIPPTLPIPGALTVLGATHVGSAQLDGRDFASAYDPQRDDCGPHRDTSSIHALVTQSTSAGLSPIYWGTVLLAHPAQLAAWRAQFDSGFRHIRARAAPRALSPFNGVPSRSAWSAMVIADTSGVTIRDSSRHTGLLAIDGDLVVRGTLRVDGALVVRGAIDASAGELVVYGALLVRDASARGSSLGDHLEVRYAPCLVGRAMSAVAVVQSGRYGIWNSP